MIKQSPESVSRLLDSIIEEFSLKNDAALSRKLTIATPSLSNVRHGRVKVGPSFILRVHEVTGMPVKRIRKILAE